MKDLVAAQAHPDPGTGTTILSLDGLRGIAILMVICQHCIYFPPNIPYAKEGNGLLQAGRLGVAIFFVLSGFLMGLVVFHSKRKFQTLSYARRRFARIYPPFILSVLFGSCLQVAWGGDPFLIHESAWMYLLTLANFNAPPVEINSVYWSLLIEIHFYILLPMVYCLMRRMSRSADLWTCILFAAVPVGTRIWYYMATPGAGSGWNGFPLVLPQRFDSFAGGLFFATLYLRQNSDTRSHAGSQGMCASGALLLIVTFLSYGLTFIHPGLLIMNIQVIFLEAAYVASELGACMILWMVFKPDGWWSKLFSNRFLVTCGLVSYEWYLFHYPLVHICKKWLPNGTVYGYLAKIIVPSVGGFLLSLLVFFCFSRPLQECIRRGFKPANQVPNGL